MGHDVRSARRAITVFFALNGLAFGSWAARIPAIRAHADLSDGALGVALAGLALGAIVAMPLVGALAARRGSASVARGGIAAVALAIAVVALAPSLPVLCVATVALGVGNGWLDVAMNAHGVTVEQRAGRPILGGMHAAFSAGGLAGGALGALAAGAELDARVHLPLVGALVLAGGLLAGRRLLPDSDDAGHASQPLFVRPPRSLLVLGLVAFAALQVEGATADWSAVYLRDELSSSAAVAALGFTTFSVTMTAGRLAADALAQRIGERRLVRAGGAVAALGFGLALLAASPIPAIVGCACLGLGMASVVPIVFRSAGASPGIAPGVALAAVSSTGYLGFLAGPPTIGALAELTSLPDALIYVVALSALVALSASAVGSRARGPELAPARGGAV